MFTFYIIPQKPATGSCIQTVLSTSRNLTLLKSILILSSHLRLGIRSGTFVLGYPIKILIGYLLLQLHA
jgi:hypothetical protein